MGFFPTKDFQIPPPSILIRFLWMMIYGHVFGLNDYLNIWDSYQYPIEQKNVSHSYIEERDSSRFMIIQAKLSIHCSRNSTLIWLQWNEISV